MPPYPNIYMGCDCLLENLINCVDLVIGCGGGEVWRDGPLVSSVRDILQHGLTNERRGFWHLVRELSHVQTRSTLKRSLKHVHSPIERGTYWIYLTLVEGWLDCYLASLASDRPLLSKWYQDYAFMRSPYHTNRLVATLAGLADVTLLPSDSLFDISREDDWRRSSISASIETSPSPDITQLHGRNTITSTNDNTVIVAESACGSIDSSRFSSYSPSLEVVGGVDMEDVNMNWVDGRNEAGGGGGMNREREADGASQRWRDSPPPVQARIGNGGHSPSLAETSSPSQEFFNSGITEMESERPECDGDPARPGWRNSLMRNSSEVLMSSYRSETLDLHATAQNRFSPEVDRVGDGQSTGTQWVDHWSSERLGDGQTQEQQERQTTTRLNRTDSVQSTTSDNAQVINSFHVITEDSNPWIENFDRHGDGVSSENLTDRFNAALSIESTIDPIKNSPINKTDSLTNYLNLSSSMTEIPLEYNESTSSFETNETTDDTLQQNGSQLCIDTENDIIYRQLDGACEINQFIRDRDIINNLEEFAAKLIDSKIESRTNHYQQSDNEIKRNEIINVNELKRSELLLDGSNGEECDRFKLKEQSLYCVDGEISSSFNGISSQCKSVDDIDKCVINIANNDKILSNHFTDNLSSNKNSLINDESSQEPVSLSDSSQNQLEDVAKICAEESVIISSVPMRRKVVRRDPALRHSDPTCSPVKRQNSGRKRVSFHLDSTDETPKHRPILIRHSLNEEKLSFFSQMFPGLSGIERGSEATACEEVFSSTALPIDLLPMISSTSTLSTSTDEPLIASNLSMISSVELDCLKIDDGELASGERGAPEGQEDPVSPEITHHNQPPLNHYTVYGSEAKIREPDCSIYGVSQPRPSNQPTHITPQPLLRQTSVTTLSKTTTYQSPGGNQTQPSRVQNNPQTQSQSQPTSTTSTVETDQNQSHSTNQLSSQSHQNPLTTAQVLHNQNQLMSSGRVHSLSAAERLKASSMSELHKSVLGVERLRERGGSQVELHRTSSGSIRGSNLDINKTGVMPRPKISITSSVLAARKARLAGKKRGPMTLYPNKPKKSSSPDNTPVSPSSEDSSTIFESDNWLGDIPIAESTATSPKHDRVDESSLPLLSRLRNHLLTNSLHQVYEWADCTGGPVLAGLTERSLCLVTPLSLSPYFTIQTLPYSDVDTVALGPGDGEVLTLITKDKRLVTLFSRGSASEFCSRLATTPPSNNVGINFRYLSLDEFTGLHTTTPGSNHLCHQDCWSACNNLGSGGEMYRWVWSCRPWQLTSYNQSDLLKRTSHLMYSVNGRWIPAKLTLSGSWLEIKSDVERVRYRVLDLIGCDRSTDTPPHAAKSPRRFNQLMDRVIQSQVNSSQNSVTNRPHTFRLRFRNKGCYTMAASDDYEVSLWMQSILIASCNASCETSDLHPHIDVTPTHRFTAASLPLSLSGSALTRSTTSSTPLSALSSDSTIGNIAPHALQWLSLIADDTKIYTATLGLSVVSCVSIEDMSALLTAPQTCLIELECCEAAGSDGDLLLFFPTEKSLDDFLEHLVRVRPQLKEVLEPMSEAHPLMSHCQHTLEAILTPFHNLMLAV